MGIGRPASRPLSGGSEILPRSRRPCTRGLPNTAPCSQRLPHRPTDKGQSPYKKCRGRNDATICLSWLRPPPPPAIAVDDLLRDDDLRAPSVRRDAAERRLRVLVFRPEHRDDHHVAAAQRAVERRVRLEQQRPAQDLDDPACLPHRLRLLPRHFPRVRHVPLATAAAPPAHAEPRVPWRAHRRRTRRQAPHKEEEAPREAEAVRSGSPWGTMGRGPGSVAPCRSRAAARERPIKAPLTTCCRAPSARSEAVVSPKFLARTRPTATHARRRSGRRHAAGDAAGTARVPRVHACATSRAWRACGRARSGHDAGPVPRRAGGRRRGRGTAQEDRLDRIACGGSVGERKVELRRPACVTGPGRHAVAGVSLSVRLIERSSGRAVLICFGHCCDCSHTVPLISVQLEARLPSPRHTPWSKVSCATCNEVSKHVEPVCRSRRHLNRAHQRFDLAAAPLPRLPQRSLATLVGYLQERTRSGGTPPGCLSSPLSLGRFLDYRRYAKASKIPHGLALAEF